MYCNNCGTFLNDGDAFCPNCGAANRTQAAPNQNISRNKPEPVPARPSGLSKNAKIGIIVGAAAAVVLAIVLILVFALGGSNSDDRGGSGSSGGSGFNSPKAVIKKLAEVEQTHNLQDMVDLCYPDEVLDSILKEYDITKSEYKRIIKEAQEEIDEDNSSSEEYTVKVVDSETLDKDELEDLNDWYRDKYGTSRKYISEAQELTVNAVDAYGDEEEDYVTVVKIDGKWYLSLKQIGDWLPYYLRYR